MDRSFSPSRERGRGEVRGQCATVLSGEQERSKWPWSCCAYMFWSGVEIDISPLYPSINPPSALSSTSIHHTSALFFLFPLPNPSFLAPSSSPLVYLFLLMCMPIKL
uniref:Uncharacterized protein n=1 Tax=Setaria italica TaxID=4555 RepID=K3YWY9_SETIT